MGDTNIAPIPLPLESTIPLKVLPPTLGINCHTPNSKWSKAWDNEPSRETVGIFLLYVWVGSLMLKG